MKNWIFTIVVTLLLSGCSSGEQTASTKGSSSSVASMKQQSSTVSAGSTTSRRRSCTQGDLQVRPERIEEWSNSWNHDSATTTVSLDRPEQGFSVMIPYNPDWGSGEVDCQLTPYEANETVITFGFAGIFEGGGATRFNTITLQPSRSLDEAITAITAQQEPDREQGILPPGTEPRVVTINSNTAVQYFSGGFCDQTYVEVIGKQFNYVFSSICNVDESGIKAALETLELYD